MPVTDIYGINSFCFVYNRKFKNFRDRLASRSFYSAFIEVRGFKPNHKAAKMASEDYIMKEESIEAVSLISDGLSAVMEGCRLPVKMKNPSSGFEEWPKAEVIAIKASDATPTLYYVHYVDYNKRLDEWVTEDR